MLTIEVKVNEWNIRRYSALRALDNGDKGECVYSCHLYVFDVGKEATYKAQVSHTPSDGLEVLMEKMVKVFSKLTVNKSKKSTKSLDKGTQMTLDDLIVS